MNEVSTQIVALVVDALDAHGLDPDQLWDGLAVDRARVAAGGRIDWTTWVAMMARVEDTCGAEQMETLFVPGAGAREPAGRPKYRGATLPTTLTRRTQRGARCSHYASAPSSVGRPRRRAMWPLRESIVTSR